MDVRRQAGIGHGPDRAEAVAARLIGYYLAIALEILVERPVGPIIVHIMVPAVCVALPDPDPRAGNRLSGRIENTSRDVCDGGLCHAVACGDLHEGIVGLPRERKGIEKSLCAGRAMRTAQTALTTCKKQG